MLTLVVLLKWVGIVGLVAWLGLNTVVGYQLLVRNPQVGRSNSGRLL